MCLVSGEVWVYGCYAATANGASPNRTFMGIHRAPGSTTFPFKVLNPFASTERYVDSLCLRSTYLIKTTRNCWAGNKCHLGVSWNITIAVCLFIPYHYSVMGKRSIWWSHLQDLYYQDSGAKKSARGLPLVPKLKYEHIHLTLFSKMRVDLAAQLRRLIL